MARRIQLLIIDPQNDFCDLPPAWCPVDPMAAQRLAAFIDAAAGRLTGITVTLDASDMILIVGEAGSHCVEATTEHIVEHLPRGQLERVVLAVPSRRRGTDCMSPVTGFAAQQDAFLATHLGVLNDL